MYYSLLSHGIFPEQKWCRKGTSGILELLYKDQDILNESKKRRKKTSYGVDLLQKGLRHGPQNWILHCLEIYEISDQIVQYVEKTMETWRAELTVGGNG